MSDANLAKQCEELTKGNPSLRLKTLPPKYVNTFVDLMAGKHSDRLEPTYTPEMAQVLNDVVQIEWVKFMTDPLMEEFLAAAAAAPSAAPRLLNNGAGVFPPS